ncbi:MAG: hypothetical protein JOZ90_13890 [Alphaproteobacteria bacterium]|nr:hypothetical protein [Alphaproteobacteria bacterium]MBV9372490.1 hypothetical protein [Alphaproteobacteria bacterium]MBV9902165.1 hypothetical protein [Alphaproteobacteria bacterium]
MKIVHVPLLDILNYKRADGSLQVDVVNLWGASFTLPSVFPTIPLALDPDLEKALTDGSVQKLQAAGVKVVLTIAGSGGNSVGWDSVPAASIYPFAKYLDETILGEAGYGLDGVDIDAEYARQGTGTLPAVVRAMRETFPSTKIISKALWSDLGIIREIAPDLSFGSIMTYGDDAGGLESIFNSYVEHGMAPEKMAIGVSAGPVGHGPQFTSIPTAQALAGWQPANGRKMGMMVWSFSQDIQQFTAWPQNQPDKTFPNPDDHSVQRAIIRVFDEVAP